MNGYADRGNPILGTWMDSSGGRDYYVSLNRTHPTPTPYTTISYANGPGFSFHYDNKTGFWRDLSNVDTQADDFQQLGSFHFDYETHGGEDVPLYAVGPQAHLLTGVHEQSYIAHVVSYAACLQESSVGCPNGSSGSLSASILTSFVSLIISLLSSYLFLCK